MGNWEKEVLDPSLDKAVRQYNQGPMADWIPDTDIKPVELTMRRPYPTTVPINFVAQSVTFENTLFQVEKTTHSVDLFGHSRGLPFTFAQEVIATSLLGERKRFLLGITALANLKEKSAVNVTVARVLFQAPAK